MTLQSGYLGEASPAALAAMPRICVRPPYFALEQLDYDGRLHARVNASQPRTREAGPMRAAEVSRHAAIAGLACAALAQESPERCYYLANHAHYRAFRNDAPYGSDVWLTASLLEGSNRYVKAQVELRAATPLAALEVGYSVLKARLFDKLFAGYRRDTSPSTAIAPLPRGDLKAGSGWLEHHLESLPIECCAGHFENYPALPVALLVAEISYLSELLLDSETFIHEARVRADRLCWAFQPLSFRVEHRGGEGRLHRFYGEARTAEGLSAQAEFAVEAL